MNKHRAVLTFYLLLFLHAAGSGRCLGQEKIDYRVEFPNGDAAWTILFDTNKLLANSSAKTPSISATERETVTNEADAVPVSPLTEKAGARILKIEIIRQGDLRRDTVYWSGGKMLQYWWSTSAQYVFFQHGDLDQLRGMKASQMESTLYDESLFSWVSPRTYKEDRVVSGKKCWYFEKTSKITLPNGDLDTETVQAWIAPETARPIGWSNGARSVFFAFSEIPPGEQLVLPQKFREQFARYDAYTSAPKRLKRR